MLSPQVTHTPNVPSSMRRSAASIRRKRVLRWLLLSNKDSFDKLMTHRSALSCAESISSDRVSRSTRLRNCRTSCRCASSLCRNCSMSSHSMVCLLRRATKVGDICWSPVTGSPTQCCPWLARLTSPSHETPIQVSPCCGGMNRRTGAEMGSDSRSLQTTEPERRV